ncbi:hypothetical protein F4780DRAFT_751901 [Xylariomycetidae sp. FL0641]|nr:hypothetical protein F4780DRAFT_751901 [Xylariomycetidae sp. FL0641]
MADPLLTSLCTICRIEEPRYKCPRCGTRTCSLACVKKHKNWSSCNGERDPTVFIPREKLKTDAGVDHDYNFLTKIERSVEQAEKILREERDILPQGPSSAPPNKKLRLHKGQSRGKTTLEDSTRKWERNTISRMRRLGIHVASVPYGMARSKENKTSWNRRTGTINWQVEWIDMTTAESPNQARTDTQSRRILHKILDEAPLYEGFADAKEIHRQRQLSETERAQEKQLRKQQGSSKGGQNTTSTAWEAQLSWMQDPQRSTWSEAFIGQSTGIPGTSLCRFFYHKPKTPSKEAPRLIPVDSADTLASLLPGFDVLEFPTFYVFPPDSEKEIEGFVIENKPKKAKDRKRKASALVEYGSGGESSGEEEEGEVADRPDANDDTSDDTTSSSGSDSDPEMDES